MSISMVTEAESLADDILQSNEESPQFRSSKTRPSFTNLYVDNFLTWSINSEKQRTSSSSSAAAAHAHWSSLECCAARIQTCGGKQLVEMNRFLWIQSFSKRFIDVFRYCVSASSVLWRRPYASCSCILWKRGLSNKMGILIPVL